VLATDPNAKVGSGYGSNLELDSGNGLYHSKSQTVGIGLVLPPNTCHVNYTPFALIRYLILDRIVTLSIFKLSSLPTLSPFAFIFPIRPIDVGLLLKTCEYCVYFVVIT